MRTFSRILLLVALLTGCITKSAARRQAQHAFLAGQRTAAAERQAGEISNTNTVRFIGDVQHPTVEWAEDLTLAEAFLAAEYFGDEPRDIVIRRAGQIFHVDPQSLLSGQDELLQPGDVIEIR